MRQKPVWSKITKEQARDTGMAMVLLCLIAALVSPARWPLVLATVLLVLDLTMPLLFSPLAVVWLGLGALLGTIFSRVMLAVLFALLVTPVGVLRRWLGADALQLKQWKRGEGSVFRVREHTYRFEDIKDPY